MGSLEADDQQQSGSAWRRSLVRVGVALVALALAALVYLWFSRERIAGDFIDSYLAANDIQASYDIVQIGAARQIVANVVVGDPAAPDLTIERVVTDIGYTFGTPYIARVRLERPRLYATYRDGAFSLGALDPLLFAEDEEAVGLPELELTVVDGGALLRTDAGHIGAAFEGSGQLDDGFSGTLAAVAPELELDACRAQRLTVFGALTITSGAPRFEGPVRLRDAECAGATLASADLAADLSLTDDLTRLEADLSLAARELAFAESGARRLEGEATFTVGEGALVLDHDISASGLYSPYAALADLHADGALRSARDYSQSTWNAQIEGAGVNFAEDTEQALAQAREAMAETLLAPLIAKFERGLTTIRQSSELRGNVTWRSEPDAQSLVIPQANLRNASGETVLAISRLAWSATKDAGIQRLSGNFLTGGRDLPPINGRIDQDQDGRLAIRLAMDDYASGSDRIAVPALLVRGAGDGAYVFSGSARASGAIPGGAIDSLIVPVTGSFSQRGGLRLGTVCSDLRFAALSYSELSLSNHTVRACPADGEAMLAYNKNLTISVATSDLALTGALAGSRTQIRASSAALTYPGGFELEDLIARIGEEDNAVHLSSAALTGRIGDTLGGEFTGGSAALDIVPLDLDEMRGSWAYEDGVLSVSDARFRLTDRVDGEARFEPLQSRDAALTLDGNAISAEAQLRHPGSDTLITDVVVVHNLSSGGGSALLSVDDLRFGRGLSPADLTYLVEGVTAYTNGVVSGEGRVAWTSDDITSSGAFRTDRLDLSAAFGPVRGLKGEVRFSDLLNITTEPSQEVTIESINPGIEALAGTVRFSLTNGEIIELEDARWPFMGGTLVMEPTRLLYGTDADQRYAFTVTGLDAAKFVTQMELTNLSATGTFDGTVPIIFDSDGNGRIVGGSLKSRPPGGNVSYIGELTYEDMGAISNYAFQSLRSLDYRRMDVDLDGDLAGEIITRFGIDGVRQGKDASRNFVTRRLAKLPIRFNVNVRSENFYELATMVRTFWDPEAVPDPGAKGLIDSKTIRVNPPSAKSAPADPSPDRPKDAAIQTDALRPDEPGVQPSESETLP
ncbi:MAG: YdbH domain-containing protein [Pseudomonadota bacterium]